MAVRILQVTFQFQSSPDVYERTIGPLSNAVAAVPGLRWNIGLLNADQRVAGCLYLFDDEASLEAYLAGPIIAGLARHPLLSQFSMQRFEVLDGITSITAGPTPPDLHWQD